MLLPVFVIQLSFIPPAQSANDRTTLMVRAETSGEFGEASQKTANLLSEKLGTMPGIYVIDSKKVDTILDYYKTYDAGENLPDLETAQSLLTQAKEHYFNFEYKVAEAELQRIVTFFDRRPELLFDAGLLLRDTHVTLGLVRVALRGKNEAVQDFQNALKLDSNYQLSEINFPPSIHQLFANAATLQSQQPKGSLTVQTSPKVVEVYLNGVYRGVSPLTLNGLEAGEHFLSLKANRYESVNQKVTIISENPVTVERKLSWVFRNPGKQREERKPENTVWRQVADAVRVANLLKVDKVLTVQATPKKITTRLVDRQLRTSLKPIIISLRGNTKTLERDIDQLVRLLYAQTQLDLSKNAAAHIDTQGIGDPIVLGKRPRKLNKKIIWGGVAALSVSGLLMGLLSGNDGGKPVGAVSVNFE